jgi:ABC-2 type transport system permease protein
MVGALFPAVGDSIGKLDLPKGVTELLGGADYGTLAGWFRSEIGAVYGPLVIAATAITGAVAATAGEEEDGILGLTLAHPVGRGRLVLAKAAAVALCVAGVALGTLLGLVAGVAVAGGGVALGHLAALALHLAFYGWSMGALARLRPTGRRARVAEVRLAVLLLRRPRPDRPRRRRRRPRRPRRGDRRAHGDRRGRDPAARPARLGDVPRDVPNVWGE